MVLFDLFGKRGNIGYEWGIGVLADLRSSEGLGSFGGFSSVRSLDLLYSNSVSSREAQDLRDHEETEEKRATP